MKTIEDHYLSEAECELLLRIARESLVRYLEDGEHLSLEGYALSPALQEKHGAFVTLRESGALRGCIGYTKSIESLAETVRDNAINAGVRDPRFEPLQRSDLAKIDIEISALCPGEEPGSPFIRVEDLGEIVIGRDGLYLEHAGSRGGGLLLPQVPVEQGWDLDAYLAGICAKAGAPPEAWKQADATLYRFSAQVFQEEQG